MTIFQISRPLHVTNQNGLRLHLSLNSIHLLPFISIRNCRLENPIVMRTVRSQVQIHFSRERRMQLCNGCIQRHPFLLRRLPHTLRHLSWKTLGISKAFQDCIPSIHQLSPLLRKVKIHDTLVEHNFRVLLHLLHSIVTLYHYGLK